MAEPKNGRPIFFPEKLVIFGNLALFAWIMLDTAAFLLFNITDGVVFLVVTLVLVYGLLHILGCLRPCYNCIKCTHGMDAWQPCTLADAYSKTTNTATNCPQQYSSRYISGRFQQHSHSTL